MKRHRELLANMSNRFCPASSATWCDWCLLSVMCGDGRGCTKWDRRDRLTQNRENA